MTLPIYIDDFRERRQHVRVYDAVSLHIELIPLRELLLKIDNFAIDRERFLEAQYFYDALVTPVDFPNHSDPLLSNAIELLDKKIGTIARHLNKDSVELPSHPTHKVNLSVNGICFGTSTPMPRGQSVWLGIQLFPTMFRFPVIVETVSCLDVDRRTLSGTFGTGAKFLHIDPGDREILHCHIEALRAQSQVVHQTHRFADGT